MHGATVQQHVVPQRLDKRPAVVTAVAGRALVLVRPHVSARPALNQHVRVAARHERVVGGLHHDERHGETLQAAAVQRVLQRASTQPDAVVDRQRVGHGAVQLHRELHRYLRRRAHRQTASPMQRTPRDIALDAHRIAIREYVGRGDKDKWGERGGRGRRGQHDHTKCGCTHEPSHTCAHSASVCVHACSMVIDVVARRRTLDVYASENTNRLK
jgi:hypothetical protein